MIGERETPRWHRGPVYGVRAPADTRFSIPTLAVPPAMPISRLFLLVLFVAAAVPASAQRTTPLRSLTSVPNPVAAPRGGVVLYDQTDNLSGDSFPSQNFQESWDDRDCQGADDFVVPDGETWEVAQVDVIGAYRADQQNPVETANLYLYADASGAVGAEIEAFVDIAVDDKDEDGDWSVVLPEAVTLVAGTYWVSVNVNMDLIVDGVGDGQWFWTKQATKKPVGGELHWRNPGDGFGTGCTEWSRLTTDCGDDGGFDVSFRLLAPPPVANDGAALPTAFSVSQNYPNPFAVATEIDVELPAASRLTVTVYDVLGREVAVLLDAYRPAGGHRITWTASGVPTGVYFAQIESAAGQRTLRMTVAR